MTICIRKEIMNRPKSVYPSAGQKKKLIDFIEQHPELIPLKVSQDVTSKDSQQLWRKIANECNAIPGATKTWYQWRKTWQDMKSKNKKKLHETGGSGPRSIVIMLTPKEQKALALTNVSSTTNCQNSSEPELSDRDNIDRDNTHIVHNVSPSVFIQNSPTKENMEKPHSQHNASNNKNSTNSSLEHSNSCLINCDKLAVQDQRKLQLKEDYYNFRKKYLKQKLLLMKAHTEVLRDIARELAK